MQVLVSTPDKQRLIELLRNHGTIDLHLFLMDPAINERDLILAAERSKLKISDLFFSDLAKELNLRFLQKEELERRSELTTIFPYKVLSENLVVPLELTRDRLTIATANPLNTEFFRVLENTLGVRVQIYVASVDAIKDVIEKGYGVIHKYRALQDLRYRSPDDSAYRVLYPWQRYLIIGVLVLFAILFIVNYPLSFILIFAAINIVYFCVNPIKFYVSFRGFQGSRRSIRVSDDDVRKLDENDLPVYTILVPIYREAAVLPHIVENVYKLAYPHQKLDVKILMEEKDEETIRAAKRLGLFGSPETVVGRIASFESRKPQTTRRRFVRSTKVIDSGGTVIGTLESVVPENNPAESILTVRRKSGDTIEIPESFVDSAEDVVLLRDKLDVLMAHYLDSLKVFDAVIVPDAEIRTKPRACNYGLLRAKGEYCVIYDAEDDPEPDQLKKAVIAFSRAGKDVVCLQSRLNFYNPKENLLTRWFSLEYSFWYDYYLDGLDRVGAPLPLGGTSNHFRTEKLREVGGWDPYNVTEDADLGVRISRRKLKTAMLNSYTFEEANNKLPNWIRQRSRWSKGYVQTYLVHMRHPHRLLREMGWKRFFYFQLTFGGNILLPLINPLLWAVTLLTLVRPGIFDFLFFYPIVYVCIFNLLIGNGVYILLHLGPYVVKKNYTSIPLALIIPFYWVLISIGDWRGTIQLISKPFYWEKTQHGLSHVHGAAQA